MNGQREEQDGSRQDDRREDHGERNCEPELPIDQSCECLDERKGSRDGDPPKGGHVHVRPVCRFVSSRKGHCRLGF